MQTALVQNQQIVTCKIIIVEKWKASSKTGKNILKHNLKQKFPI
jgi:hypothetical protein